VLRRGAGLVRGLVVHTDRMRANVTGGSYGLVFSQAVLLALVASGMERDAAYRIVQRDARVAWEERRPLRAVLEDDPEVELDAGALDGAFSLERALHHVSRFTQAIQEVEA
jgi:adenylosuccinate lyase